MNGCSRSVSYTQLDVYKRQVLREASKIVFITPSIKERLLSHWTLHSMGEIIKQKCVVLSNGINDFWHEHFCAVRCCRDNAVAYIGRFDNNKNVIRLIKAVLMLQDVYKRKG